MRYLLLLFSFLLINNESHAQDTLEVLPATGRNELFHDFLMDRGAKLWDERRDSVASSLVSAQKLIGRQQQLREGYLSMLGTLPDKTPLNAVITDTIQRTGFRIEKVHFQSVPSHRVTGNFYIPDSGSVPYPAVLVLCGHYPNAKAALLLQNLCELFANHGIAALIVDPFSQGERNQIQHPTNGALLFKGQSGTSAHTRLDVGSMLVGSSVVAQALWDNHRAMDYLYSRTDVVDTSRVGCTGSSGGGSQAAYLCAFDQRIKVAAVNSFLMNEETLFATIGPQTGSQNLSFEGAHLIDHPDYVTLFAPKPYLILAGTQDFFDINATRNTYAESQDVYNTLGVPGHVKYFEEDSVHGYLKARREVAVNWFKTWFYNDTTPVIEPRWLGLSTTDLWVTGDGQVVTSFPDERTVTDLNVDVADSLADDRANFWAQNQLDSCLNKVRELIRLEAYDSVQVEETGVIDRGHYTITRMKINSGDHVPVTGLLFVPKNLSANAPGVVYVDGRGKKTEAGVGGVLETRFIDSGKIVLTIDLRGFGETVDNPAKNESKHGNREHRNAVISAYIGKTLIGQRVEDIMKALDVMYTRTDIDTSDLTLVGIDRAGPAVLHAAALDKRVKQTLIRASFESWLPIVADPTQLHNMTHVVPFALKYYDLPDLVASMSDSSVKYFQYPYTAVSIDDKLVEEKYGSLGQNYPNPFNSTSMIPFRLKKAGGVTLRVYDQHGRLCKVLSTGMKAVGEHNIKVEMDSFPAGQYFYTMWVDRDILGSKVMIIK